ncbi:hypothetical protein, partial [Klebsiella pneumoniae]|uniref:hypothetical protein n=1 Tax=Klebsiella pneumoniae TaxID=573 RepID=UPI0019535601
IMICPVSFAIGNLLLRKANGAPMFDLFAWLCLIAAVPLVVLTLVTNGAASSWQEMTHASLKAIVSVLCVGAITTSFAYWL